jgi:hypothetical protein
LTRYTTKKDVSAPSILLGIAVVQGGNVVNVNNLETTIADLIKLPKGYEVKVSIEIASITKSIKICKIFISIKQESELTTDTGNSKNTNALCYY